MSFNNEQNIKRRIGILTILILLVCGGVIWAGIKLSDMYDRSVFLFWDYRDQIERIEENIDKKFNTIILRIDSLNPTELIDSPVNSLPEDKKRIEQDSIRNILNDILKYYEQQAKA
ncbi:hypothetical protein [Dysgonomonas termitidis]|uniref:Chemotaxis methyl-accepting receptor HlyB-like 4HB MCP domain-containing protein n=1 Tax=Dysgonomonas termitidis TaxID=1516126 RepID=A0ABV9KYJ9_9BACT